MALLEYARPQPSGPPTAAKRAATEPAPWRLPGVDIARGLAILGVAGAHLAPARWEISASDPVSWLMQGHASVVFVLATGLTLGLAARTNPGGPPALRLRILVQAVLIFLAGGLLNACNTHIANILPPLAVMLGLSLPVLYWPTRRLLVLAAGCALTGPVLITGLPSVLRFFGQVDSQPVNLFFTGTHPVAVWMAYLLTGLAIGRSGLLTARRPARLAAAGALLAGLGYGSAWLLARIQSGGSAIRSDRRVPYPADGTVLPPGVTLGEQTPPLPRADWSGLLRAEPFSNTTFSVLGATGCALLVLAATLTLGLRAQRALMPVAGAGAMALSVYVAHLLAVFLLDPRNRTPGASNPLVDPGLLVTAFAVIGIGLMLAHSWWLRFGHGPLELALRCAADWAVRTPAAPSKAVVPARRVTGIDIARGAAVLGMFTAHLSARTRTLSWTDPVSWLSLVHGRSSILFALLAGVSLGLLVRGRVGQDPVALRMWVLVRAAVIFAIGGLLLAFGTQIAIILQVYALMFVLCVPLLGWARRHLLALAVACAVAGPFLVTWLPSVLRFYPRVDSQPIDLALTGIYPAVVWMAYMLAGLAIGRSDLAAAATRLRMAAGGVALMVAGYGTAWLIGFFFHPGRTPPATPRSPDARLLPLPGDAVVLPPGLSPGEGAPAPLPAPFWDGLLTAEPHSNTTFEVAGSTGFVLVLLALALSLRPAARTLLHPLAAVGAMALTAYIAQVIAIFLIEPRNRIPHVSHPLVDPTQNWLILCFIAVTLLTAVCWQLLVGRGPAEALLKLVGERAAGIPAGAAAAGGIARPPGRG